ncbi:hypothetical protein COMNV_00021 [Commensalibacter sp. Nvir]|uniref:hypothetical protein n=1 Tax=Commensalibacter sp. Nvir TaxID=3069817 RepID=UPI002D56A5F9|nr:hypothetical protein COMNV_00021 [Commensalibacter sp. Nvir]
MRTGLAFLGKRKSFLQSMFSIHCVDKTICGGEKPRGDTITWSLFSMSKQGAVEN